MHLSEQTVLYILQLGDLYGFRPSAREFINTRQEEGHGYSRS